jgi:hypothetical protein
LVISAGDAGRGELADHLDGLGGGEPGARFKAKIHA